MPTDVQMQVIEVYGGEDAPTPMALTPAQDISGWTLEATVSRYPGGPALFQLGVGTGVTVTDPANALYLVTFGAANTGSLLAQYGEGYYWWDTWRTDAGVKTRLQGGMILVRQPVGP